MSWESDFQEKIKNVPRCKTCKFYDSKPYPQYSGKVAICECDGSGYYKVGLYTVSCEFYQEKGDSKQ